MSQNKCQKYWQQYYKDPLKPSIFGKNDEVIKMMALSKTMYLHKHGNDHHNTEKELIILSGRLSCLGDQY